MISFCGGTPKVIGTFLLKKLSDSSALSWIVHGFCQKGSRALELKNEIERMCKFKLPI
jgi:hypothetical protein